MGALVIPVSIHPRTIDSSRPLQVGEWVDSSNYETGNTLAVGAKRVAMPMCRIVRGPLPECDVMEAEGVVDSRGLAYY